MKTRLIVSRLAFIAIPIVLTTPGWGSLLEVNFGGTNSGGTINGGTTCVDNTVCDTNPLLGAITTAAGTLGTLSIAGTVSTSSSPTAGLSFALNGTPTALGMFTFAVSDNGFNNPSGPLLISQDISGLSAPNVGATTGVAGTLSAVGFLSNSNVAFATNDGSTSTATTSLKALPGVGLGGPFGDGVPYSLTEFITINITALATTTDKTFQVNADVATTAATVPEPSSIVLVGSGLLLAATRLRRKLKH